MKQLDFRLAILLFIGITYAQPQVTIQTDAFDITLIEDKAILDASTDFNKYERWIWGGGSTLSGLLSVFAFSGYEEYAVILVPVGLALASAPPVAAKVMDVDFPKTRIMGNALDIESERYRSVYRSRYMSETRKLRFTYSLASPVASVATVLGLYYWLIVLGHIAS